MFGLQRTLAEVQRKLERCEKTIGQLEKRVKKAEAERDHFKALYTKARAEIRERDKTIETLTARLDENEKQLAWFREQKFGSTSEAEKSPVKQTASKEKSKKKRNRGQQPGSEGHGRSPLNLVPDVVPLDLDNICCTHCAKPFKRLPETDNSSLIEIQTDIYQTEYQRSRYARQCKCAGPKIITAPLPPKLYPKTSIGNSLWVHFCVQKFLHGVPTSRILKDLALREFGLAVGTVTGGLKIIKDLLEPLYQAIALFCQSEKYWHADETSWRVFLDKDGKSIAKKWWLWVIAGKRAVTYVVDQSRSRRVPEEFFAGSVGVLMTDRYSAYKSLPRSIRKAWCWVHVRRDFIKLLPIKKLKKWTNSWLEQISTLFLLNDQRFELWSERKDFGSEWTEACQKLEQHLQGMQNEWRSQLQKPLQKQQRTALLSMQRHWDGLTLFLSDPYIPLENNKAERLLRQCVINRKNSYGSGSYWSGQLAARLFTIFQTWLINGLNPQSLLLDYFNQCSLTPGKPPPSIVNFLPWKMTPERLGEFRLPDSYKRPA